MAAVVFLHGFSDHCNRYNELHNNLANAGIVVYGFDQRGWGRSVKKPTDKGDSGPTTQVLADISSVIQSHLPSPVPLFLMGHSMGGGETLLYAAVGPSEVKKQLRGFVAAAPLIRIHPNSEPNRITVFAGKLAGKWLPKRQMVSTLGAEHMSHDEVINKDWEQDPLCHDTGTLEGMAGMLERSDDLDKGKATITDWNGCSVLLMHGTGDVVTSHEATRKFTERLKIRDKTMKLYERSYHCSTFLVREFVYQRLLTSA